MTWKCHSPFGSLSYIKLGLILEALVHHYLVEAHRDQKPTPHTTPKLDGSADLFDTFFNISGKKN